MKSRRRNNPKLRILVVIGGGLECSLGPEVIRLLSEAGFEIHTVLLNEANERGSGGLLKVYSKDVSVESEFYFSAKESAEPFVALLGLGVSAPSSSSFFCGGAESVFGMLQSEGGFAMILTSSGFSNLWKAKRKNTQVPLFVHAFPPERIGSFKAAAEETFARLIRTIDLNKPITRFGYFFNLNANPNEENSSTSSPFWRDELEEILQESGFRFIPPIDYPRLSTIELDVSESQNFRPEFTGFFFSDHFVQRFPSNSHPLIVHFVSGNLQKSSIPFEINEKTMVAARRISGDLQLISTHGERLLPNLSFRPAFFAFADFLLKHISKRKPSESAICNRSLD